MTRKKKDPKASDAAKPKARDEPGKSPEAIAALAATDPSVTATLVTAAFARGLGDVDVVTAHDALLKQTKHVHDGNMQDVEATLVAQAAALNNIFTDLAIAARRQEYMQQFEANLKLALRAQNQCRMTLETLATIKNPPVVFAKQANIANNQQVNNGHAVPATRAGETKKPQTELLEAPHAKPGWMDTGAARTATSSNQAVESVGAIDGTAHKDRQGHVKP